MWVIIRITLFTHTHGDKLTASKWVRGHPFMANIWRIRHYVAFGLMSHSALCRIWHYVAFGLMSHSALCRIWTYVAFGIMSHSDLCRIQHYVAFSIMSHSALCRIRGYVVVARQGGKIKYGDGKREKQLSRKKVYIRKIRKIDKYKR